MMFCFKKEKKVDGNLNIQTDFIKVFMQLFVFMPITFE